MNPPDASLGTVTSDDDTPTFETVRIKLKLKQHVEPGTLVKIPVERDGHSSVLIGRVRSAHEHNPNERPQDIGVRDTLGLPANYPKEESSTTIYRLIEVDIIEEFVGDSIRPPQSLPVAGTNVYLADEKEVVQSLGFANKDSEALLIGHIASAKGTKVALKRSIIQRHMFIGGTTGSGKSYAMGVIAEELLRHRLPLIFIDTQDEYSGFVRALGGTVMEPGRDFTIRISSLTDRELLDFVPSMKDAEIQRNIVSAAFLELQDELKREVRQLFVLDDLLDRINVVGPQLTQSAASVRLARARTATLARLELFGTGVDRADWRRWMMPCLAVNCKHMTSRKLQTVATALLREFQDLRLRGHIPPYVMVIDEAHLFVPQGEDSPCKQIIREGVRIGRHHGISLILMTQSPVDIDKGAIRQCNTRLVFALEPDQLEAIHGVKSDSSEEMLRSLPKLPRGTCILSGTYESVRHAIPVKIRTRRTDVEDGGRAPDIFAEMDNWNVNRE